MLSIILETFLPVLDITGAFMDFRYSVPFRLFPKKFIILLPFLSVQPSIKMEHHVFFHSSPCACKASDVFVVFSFKYLATINNGGRRSMVQGWSMEKRFQLPGKKCKSKKQVATMKDA